jgi:hypothetical protein
MTHDLILVQPASGTDSVSIFLWIWEWELFKCSYIFNSDTYLDIIVTNSDSNNVDVFFEYDNGSFVNQITYTTGSYPLSVAVDDFNNDIILDIVVVNYVSNNLGVFLGNGDGTFTKMTLFPLEYGSGPFSVLVGDFNNDRKLDFAVANNGTDSLHILLQNLLIWYCEHDFSFRI